jgi:hypothetical protein
MLKALDLGKELDESIRRNNCTTKSCRGNNKQKTQKANQTETAGDNNKRHRRSAGSVSQPNSKKKKKNNGEEVVCVNNPYCRNEEAGRKHDEEDEEEDENEEEGTRAGRVKETLNPQPEIDFEDGFDDSLSY